MRYKFLIISFIIFYSFCTNSFAIENKKLSFSIKEQEYLKKNQKIKVAMLNNFKPFSYVENGVYKGLSKDILDEIGKLTSLQFEIQSNIWSISLKKFQDKEVDIISEISYTKQREKFTLFTQSYYETSVDLYVYGLKDDTNYKKFEYLKGKKIGINRGVFYIDYLKSRGIKVVELLDNSQRIQLLLTGKIDYFLAPYISGEQFVNDRQIITNIKVIDKLENRIKEDLRYGINKQNIILYSIIEKSLRYLKLNGTLDKLKNKWMLNSNTKNDKIDKFLKLTNSERNYLQIKKKITFCANPLWIPFESIEEDKHKGIAAEYKHIFEKKLNIPFELIETSSWVESLQYSKERKCDILSFLAMKTQQRKEYLSYTTAYLKIPIVLATKIDVSFVTDFENLEKRKVAILRECTLFEVLEEKYPNIQFIEVDNIDEGLAGVAQDEFFGFIGTLTSIGDKFQKEYAGELKIAGKLDNYLELSIAIRNDDKVLVNILQKTLNSINDYTHRQIFNKWASITYEQKIIDNTKLWKVIVIALIIFILFLYWNRKLNALNKELELQRKRVQEALDIKSNFLANISHEIRTPINAIMGMTYILGQSLKDEKQKKQVQSIETASNSLLRLINDILDKSKIDVGKLEIVKSNFNLLNIINNIKTIFNNKIEQKGLELKIIYDKNLPINLVGDSLRLEQILTNLITNAIKFTNKGYIELNIEQTKQNRFRFSIIDTGIGISQEQIDKVFRPFTQGDSSTTRKFGGTGLGLSICKELVELMNGSISIQSQINKGSSFIFEVDLELASAFVDIEEPKKEFKICLESLEKKDKIEKEKEEKLIAELIIAVNRKRPNLTSPILEKLNKYQLSILDNKDFNQLKYLIEKYKFKEASEILNKYER